ncbi:MAG: GntP family permease [Oscillospiraceae bacterium]|nr:GntP family permease [Oscillospiraceae bacterium]
MVSILGIIIGLIVFILMAYKGFNTIFAAIIGSIIVALFDAQDPFTMLGDAFMTKAAGFLKGYFMIFAFSALFAKVMGDSAAAASIAVKVSRLARKAKTPLMAKFLAVGCIPLVQLILTWGGVNVFVAVFIVVALARALFKEMDVPWWLYSCSSLGSSTVTIGMLPGSIQIQNVIPTEYFGSTTMAAPVLGIMSAIIALILGYSYIWFRVKQTDKRGEGFLPTGTEIMKEKLPEATVENEKPLWSCLLPMIILFVVLNVLKKPPVVALTCGIVSGYIIYSLIEKKPMDVKALFAGAIPMAVMPLVTVCCASGFGGVVGAVSGFNSIVASLTNIGVNAFTIVLIVNICSGICGSASSGENIALQNFSDVFISTGIPGAQLHRLVAMSSIGLDTLPHCAGIITMLSTTKLTHKQAYVNSFWLSVVLPIVMALFAATLISLGFYY